MLTDEEGRINVVQVEDAHFALAQVLSQLQTRVLLPFFRDSLRKCFKRGRSWTKGNLGGVGVE